MEHEKAAEIARQLGDETRRGAAVAGMALTSLRGHEFARSLDESGRAIKIGRAVGSMEIVAAGEYATGQVHAVTGDLVGASNHLERARGLSSSGGHALYESLSSALLGFIDNWRGDYDPAITRTRKAVEFARKHNRSFALLQGLFYIGLPLAGRGHYDQALTTFTEALELAEKLGEQIFRNRLLNCLGWVFAECGDLGRAIEFDQKGVGASHERGDPETIANCELNLGDAYLVKRNSGLARDYFEIVHGLARKPSTSDWMKWRYSQHLFAGLGEVWLASDDPARADDFCNQCLELATRTDSKKYLARGWRLKGEIAKARLHWGTPRNAYEGLSASPSGSAIRPSSGRPIWRSASSTVTSAASIQRAHHWPRRATSSPASARAFRPRSFRKASSARRSFGRYRS
jgi:tetratricopeptide (TPR) repeat protein